MEIVICSIVLTAIVCTIISIYVHKIIMYIEKNKLAKIISTLSLEICKQQEHINTIENELTQYRLNRRDKTNNFIEGYRDNNIIHFKRQF